MNDTEQEIQRLLDLLQPDNETLVNRWADVLSMAGEMYRSFDADGRRAMAKSTISLLRVALPDARFPANITRRFVEPPPFRRQPPDEFVYAALLVSRMVADYIGENTTNAEAAAGATAHLDRIVSHLILTIIRWREQRMGPGPLVTELGKLLASTRSSQRAFDAVAHTLGDALECDGCLILEADADTLSIAGASEPVAGLGFPTDFSLTVEESDWSRLGDDEQSFIRPVRADEAGLHGHLHRAGFRTLLVRPLMAQSRRVGALIVAWRDDEERRPDLNLLLGAVVPLIAAHLGYANQAGALEQADAAIDDLFDASPNMMCQLDRVGRIVRTNARFRAEMSMPGDVVGMPLIWLVHPAWAERFKALWNHLLTVDRVESARVDLFTAESKRLALALEGHWIHEDDGPRRTCMVGLWDVSEHLAQSKAAKRRIDELTGFAHQVAHDLKAPLRTIASFSGMLSDEASLAGTETLTELIKGIEDASEHAAELIEGLLRFAHSTDGETRRIVNLEELVASAEKALVADFRDSEGIVEIERCESEVWGDPVALGTLLTNLVGNALRYTEERPPVVKVGIEAADTGWARLYVSDHGVGIPADQQDYIFRLFARGDSQRPGTGVGLAIVRRIARNHGGEVNVESTVGEGATFRVRLPTP